MVKVLGGPAVAKVISTVIPPGNVGYVNYNLYPDNNGQGNVAMCKSDLEQGRLPERALAQLRVPERLVQHAGLHRHPGQPARPAASTW